MVTVESRQTLVNWSLLTVLVLLWGTSFMFVSISVRDIDPLSTVTARIVIGALILLVVTYAKGYRLPVAWRAWAIFFVMGLMGNALPFFLITWGQQTVSSAIAGMLMATMPLITMILAHYTLDDEKLNRFKLIGFSVGISGVILLLGPVFEGGQRAVVSGFAIFLAAGCYAVNSILVRKLPGFGPLVGACGVLVTASITLIPLWLVSPTNYLDASWGPLASVIWLGIGPTGIATIVLFIVIERAGPTFLSIINYLIPVVAFFCGAWLLSETVGWQHYLALVTILSGIAITRIRAHRRG